MSNKCALAEMWGNHIGFTYTHRRYGNNHSRGNNTIQTSWYARIEEIAGLGAYPWIPAGLPHDLMDNNFTQNNPLGITDAIGMGAQDNVGGFTNLQLYNELGSNSPGIHQFVNNVRNNQLPATGNFLNSYNTLVGFYGF